MLQSCMYSLNFISEYLALSYNFDYTTLKQVFFQEWKQFSNLQGNFLHLIYLSECAINFYNQHVDSSLQGFTHGTTYRTLLDCLVRPQGPFVLPKPFGTVESVHNLNFRLQLHIFFLLNQNLTCDCLLISVFLPKFAGICLIGA